MHVASLLRIALVVAATTFVPVSAHATGTRIFVFDDGTDMLTLSSGGTIDAVVHGRHGSRSCTYQLDAQHKADLLHDFNEPAVQAGLRAHAVYDDAKNVGRLVAGADVLEWKPGGSAAPYAVRLFYLRLRVELLKAQIRC